MDIRVREWGGSLRLGKERKKIEEKNRKRVNQILSSVKAEERWGGEREKERRIEMGKRKR